MSKKKREFHRTARSMISLRRSVLRRFQLLGNQALINSTKQEITKIYKQRWGV